MFKCDRCKKTTAAKEPMTKVVVETRVKHYTSKNGEVVGVGYETVREEKRCSGCSAA